MVLSGLDTAHWKIFSVFVYRNKMPVCMYLLSSPLNATYLVTRPTLSIISAEFVLLHSAYFWPFAPIPLWFRANASDTGSFWMSYCDIFLSHLRTQKCWGLFLIGGISVFHVYISYLESKHYIKLYMVWSQNTYIFYVTSSSYCNTTGSIHHFLSDLLIFDKGECI